MTEACRPLHIEIADASIAAATVTGPEAHFPEIFHGFEDYYHPRLRTLRRRYRIDEAIEDDADEFRKILELRHWVHSQWPSDQAQSFSGDAFAILEEAKKGTGFHCAHSMIVQEAVFSAFGFVARNLGVDRNRRGPGTGFHHGVNEVWSNSYAKWVLMDAQYDFHFERDGVPLSALEVHEAVRTDGGQGVVKAKGIGRRRAAMDNPKEPEATVHNYWWVSYHIRPDTFTHPHWTGGSRLVVFDSPAFRRTTWYRQAGRGKWRKHWAYAADAFIRTRDRHQVEWTPGVPGFRIRQIAPGELAVQVHSATPNFRAYRVRINGGRWRNSADGRMRWKLRKGENTLDVHTRNLFGVDGPVVTAAVTVR